MRTSGITTLHVTRFVDCPFSAVIEFAEQDLREHVRLVSQITDDVTDTSRKHDALLLGWEAPIPGFSPDFHGALTVRPQARGAWMRIQGSYQPPLGIAGLVFDAVFGRLIARLTLTRLLRRIARSAERRWKAFRKEIRA